MKGKQNGRYVLSEALFEVHHFYLCVCVCVGGGVGWGVCVKDITVNIKQIKNKQENKNKQINNLDYQTRWHFWSSGCEPILIVEFRS